MIITQDRISEFKETAEAAPSSKEAVGPSSPKLEGND